MEGAPLAIIASRTFGAVDSFTLLAQQSTVYSAEGDRKETATTRFDRTARKAFFERRTDATEKKTFSIPAQTPRSSVASIRVGPSAVSARPSNSSASPMVDARPAATPNERARPTKSIAGSSRSIPT